MKQLRFGLIAAGLAAGTAYIVFVSRVADSRAADGPAVERPKPLDCTGPNGVSREDVQRAQREWAKYLGTTVEVTDDLGGVKMEFVLVPPGKFLMGAHPSEIDDLRKRYPDLKREDFAGERQHEVELTKPFYLGKYEVTQQQYRAVIGSNPSDFAATGGNKDKVTGLDTSKFPVESVLWREAVGFAKALTGLSKGSHSYRLPTEAEWEYACRGGRPASQPFGVGDRRSLASTQANFDGDFPYGDVAKGPCLNRPCRVGSFPANNLGLYDLHGNVAEWCGDWHGGYPSKKVTDPTGPLEGSARVHRGGGWGYLGENCRSAYRNMDGRGDRFNYLGFRLARSVPSGPSK
jgi:formylglycine-generating enzyme required for sulfatase activity